MLWHHCCSAVRAAILQYLLSDNIHVPSIRQTAHSYTQYPCHSVSQADLHHQIQHNRATEEQWRRFVQDAEEKNQKQMAALSADKECALKEKERLEAKITALQEQEAANQSRVQELQSVADQFRNREKASERQKLALQVELAKAVKTSQKWKCQANQWKREATRTTTAAPCDKTATPGGSKRKRQTMYAQLKLCRQLLHVNL